MSVFQPLFDGGAAAPELTGAAYLQAMLDVEEALAAAQAELGMIPREAAEAIATHAGAAEYDVEALGRAARSSFQPAIPLVAALRERVGPDAAPFVHRGATSQDVVDTASMLVAKRALTVTLGEVRAAADRARQLARPHLRTPMLARTLLQAAAPTTLGLVAAGWAAALRQAHHELHLVWREGLAVQLGGAAGTQQAWGLHGARVTQVMARELHLRAPDLPWHDRRGRVLTLAAGLAGASGAAGKIGRDVTLLAQEEVGEVRERPEPGRGGSSAMAHKQNPVAAIGAVACAARAPGLLATVAQAQVGDLQRAAGAWQAEWEPLLELLRVSGSAVTWIHESLGRLEVDAARMRRNLAASGLDRDLEDAVEAAVRLVERAAEGW
ncbi:MAG: 3-carboxy-cis,cis-muconate cycloisomerase [Candidatus Dormibacteraeota bacterium]|nr:3-carboxy-cis,cis-muconate cycloisomerase [Candidatus Dormibacteraeota bacterium]